ncbi:ATP-binding protein [Elioraea sp.]|uniref:ATP-binding protein n=1 Tax=Elioraea sp. TaxID=2185103 RepID=UPI003F6E7813
MRLSTVVGALLAISGASMLAVAGTTVALTGKAAAVSRQLDSYRADLQDLIAIHVALTRVRSLPPQTIALAQASFDRLGQADPETGRWATAGLLRALREAIAQADSDGAGAAAVVPADAMARLRLDALGVISAISVLQDAASQEHDAAQDRLTLFLLAAGLGLATILALTGLAAHRMIVRPIRSLVATPDPERLLAVGGRRPMPVDEIEQTLRRIVALAEGRRAEDQRYRHLVEFLPVGVIETTPEGEIVSTNPAWRRIYRFGPDHPSEGLDIATLHLDPGLRARRVEALLAGKPIGGVETEMRRRDGSTFWCEMHASAVPDPQTGRIRIRGVHIDVSERHLLESQLHRAQKLEAVGQLTGGVAHDFNNLLTVVLGNADSLVEALGAEPALRRLAEMILHAAQRGAELTGSLLAFARKQPLEPVPTDLNALLTRIEGLLRRSLGEHVELDLHRAHTAWRAMVDPAQLESAVLNLCVNARDAMPRGGRITIETADVLLDEDVAARDEEVAPGPYVMLAVSDTGMGMTPEVLARAVDPFFTTKQQGKGTGLGLSMVWGFVKQSRGHLKIYSEQGHGTTVKLYLPRAEPQDGTAAAPAVAASVRGGNETILLVEDDALVREHVSGQLRSLGYRVLSAPDGPGALDVLEHDLSVDLLFTDVVMPGGMNGRELAALGQTCRPGLRVLYTSGYTENAIVHHGRLDPGVPLLNKPYRRDELAARVRSALDGD